MIFNLLTSEHPIAWFIALFSCPTKNKLSFPGIMSFWKFPLKFPFHYTCPPENLSDISFIPSRTHYQNKQFVFLSNKFCSLFFVSPCTPEDELGARNIYIEWKKIFIFLIFLLVKHHQIQPNIIWNKVNNSPKRLLCNQHVIRWLITLFHDLIGKVLNQFICDYIYFYDLGTLSLPLSIRIPTMFCSSRPGCRNNFISTSTAKHSLLFVIS